MGRILLLLSSLHGFQGRAGSVFGGHAGRMKREGGWDGNSSHVKREKGAAGALTVVWCGPQSLIFSYPNLFQRGFLSGALFLLRLSFSSLTFSSPVILCPLVSGGGFCGFLRSRWWWCSCSCSCSCSSVCRFGLAGGGLVGPGGGGWLSLVVLVVGWRPDVAALSGWLAPGREGGGSRGGGGKDRRQKVLKGIFNREGQTCFVFWMLAAAPLVATFT